MNHSTSTDTIAAVATASGKGGIGVVRISGPQASHIARAICSKPLIPRTATYCNFLASDGSVIDSGIALFFKGPYSFTGEDVLELQCHGGPVIVQMLLAQTLKNGVRVNYFEKGVRVENGELRLARPGEFTQRAYLNDKLDLAQAEAVADLIDAQTEQAARLAARSLQGEFSREINKLVQQVIDLRMLVEATLDFPEEEIDFLEAANARGKLAIIIEQLTTILRQAQQGALLRNGLNVVLAGAPNVGKSSLLNALAGQDIAIVTPIAGTTRDKVVQAIQIEGIALNVIDTAGLRETSDTVERIGIDRTWQEVERADLVLHLSAFASEPLAMQEDQLLLTQIVARLNQVQARHVPVLEVINKIDLATNGNQLNETPHKSFVAVSAKDRIGLDQLREQILKAVGWQGSGDSVYLARERQLSALKGALGHTQLAQEHAQHSNQFLDLMAEELRLAQNELSTITGEFSPDDLLGEIFSRFCIGK